MDEVQIQQQAVRIPSSLNDEPPIVQVAEIQVSMRQLLTVGISLATWFMFSRILSDVIGLGLGWALMLFGWVLVGGLFLAFVKRDTQKNRFSFFGAGFPVEEWLADKLSYQMGEKDFTLIEPGKVNEAYRDAEEAELAALDDDDDFYVGSGW